MASMESKEERAVDPSDVATFLKEFKEERQEVKACISRIEEATREIRILKEKATEVFTSEEEETLTKKLHTLVRGAQSQAVRAKAFLDGMKEEKQNMEERGEADSKKHHILSTHYMQMCQKYVAVVKNYQKAKQEYNDFTHKTMTRRAQIAFKGKLSDEEIQKRVAENPDTLFKDAILHSEASEEAVTAYHEAKERAKTAAFLARSAQEIRDMMADLSALVNEQSSKLDHIETNVDTTLVRVEKGNKKLTEAIDYQKKARRKYCCIAICVVILIIVMVGGMSAAFA